MNISEIMTQLISLIGALVIIVNIITEVIKKVFCIKSEKIMNVFVLALSEILTNVCLMSYWFKNDMDISIFTGVAFIVIGLLVAYAAMFGFDKLLKHLEGILKA